MGSVLFFYLFAVQLLYCYTYGSVYAECGITVPHDPQARHICVAQLFYALL